MQQANPGPALRPLGLGEVLDRAVNLCVRHFAPLVSIYLLYAVPVAVVSYFAERDFAKLISIFTDALQQASASGQQIDMDQITRQINAGHVGGLNPWTVGLLAVAFVFSPFPTAALCDAVYSFYLGRTATFGSAYATALRKYLNMFGINLLYGLAGLVAYALLFVVALIVTFALVLLAAASKVVAVLIGVLLALVALLAIILLAAIVTLSIQVSYFTCVVEGANAVTAFARGISRTFVGIGLRQSILVGCVYIAIGLGIGTVNGVGQALIVGILKSPAIGTVYETIIRIVTAAFTTAFIGIFYVDLRVREEGLDLQLAAERATVSP